MLTQVVIVEYGGKFVNTIPLSGMHWLICIALALIGIPIGIFMRFLPIKDDPANYHNQPEVDLDDDFRDVLCKMNYHVEPMDGIIISYKDTSKKENIISYLGEVISKSSKNLFSSGGRGDDANV